MNIEKLKPIPKYIQKRIESHIHTKYRNHYGKAFYAYFTKIGKELIKVTVAAKMKRNAIYMKQVAVHGIDSDKAYCRDIEYFRISGYSVSWHDVEPKAPQRWFGDGNWYEIDDKYYDPFALPVNMEYVMKQPEFRYSAVDISHTVKVLQYLRLYREYPNIEYLTKAGLTDICMRKQILRKTKTDKVFRTWLLQHKDEIIRRCYNVVEILYSYKHKVSLEKAHCIHEINVGLKKHLAHDLKEFWKNREETLSAYLNAQSVSVFLYNDYYYACKFLEIDFTDTKNCMPHDFMYWHDMRIDQKHTREAEIYREQHAEEVRKFTEMSDRYASLEFTKDGFTLIIARSRDDLIREGDALNHCVGRMNYDRKMIRGESLIFFLRKDTEIDTPFVTIEYSVEKRRVLQMYGMRNAHPSPEIQQFINKQWLPFAKKALKKIA